MGFRIIDTSYVGTYAGDFKDDMPIKKIPVGDGLLFIDLWDTKWPMYYRKNMRMIKRMKDMNDGIRMTFNSDIKCKNSN